MDCISLCSDLEKQVPLDNLVPTAMSSWVLLEPLGAQIRRTHLLSTLAPQVSPGPKDISAASTLMNHVCVYMYPDALPVQHHADQPCLPGPGAVLPARAGPYHSQPRSESAVCSCHSSSRAMFWLCSHNTQIMHSPNTFKIHLWHCSGSLLIDKPLWLPVLAWKVPQSLSPPCHTQTPGPKDTKWWPILIMPLNKIAMLFHLCVYFKAGSCHAALDGLELAISLP